MAPATYPVLYGVLNLIFGISGIVSSRIYYRYIRGQPYYTSAWELMERLRKEGNPDGIRMALSSLAGILAGTGLLVLINVR